MKKIAILCDMHLPAIKDSVQHAFLLQALEQIKQEGVDSIICLGDITAFGAVEALELYLEAVKDFTHYDVIGNAEVREETTTAYMIKNFLPIQFALEGRSFWGIQTPYGRIEESDRERLMAATDGDVIFFHHGPDRLDADSAEWLREMIAEKELLLLHGHRHRDEERYIGRTRAVGFRGMDPDKATGGYPCWNCIEVTDVSENSEIKITEKPLKICAETLRDVQNYFGLSCVDNRKDVLYATEHCVKYIELRCNGKDWVPDLELLPLLQEWRNKTNGYLSVHMPNLRFKDGKLTGAEQWCSAMEYALLVQADGLTIHPPRVKISEMPKGGTVWQEMLQYYVMLVQKMPDKVQMGIENVHVAATDDLAEERPFGVVPEDVCAWIDAINEAVNHANRVGHVLDVGHARNNAIFASKYPIGTWQQLMGKKTVAYHIHQVISTPNGFKNHNPIVDWLAPSINYTSFFFNWERHQLNHVPVFLEVKGNEYFAVSVENFEKLLS